MPGKNFDGYWTAQHVLTQLREKLVIAFEHMHPGCIMVVLFDNSTNHDAFAPDALRASKMNANPAGMFFMYVNLHACLYMFVYTHVCMYVVCMYVYMYVACMY